MPEQTTFRPLTVLSAASKSNSFALGKFSAADALVPVGVLFPSSLRGTHRLKFQVSHDDSTYFDTLQGTAQLYLTETLSKYVLVPDLIQQALLGWEFIRVATMDASNVDEVTNADFIVEIHLAAINLDNAQVADPNNSGAASSVVTGDVAAGATDSGNPVKVAGKYNSTQPTLTDGQRGDLQLASRGELLVQLSNGAFAISTNSGNDGVSVGVPLSVRAQTAVFNGTNWDRQRSRGLGVMAVAPPASLAIRATLNSVSPGVLAAAGDYTALDVLNQSASAGLSWLLTGVARASGFGGHIRKVKLTTSVAALVPRMRMHLYTSVPGTLQNDNLAFLNAAADRAAYIGYIDLPALQTSGSSEIAWAIADALDVAYQCVGSANLSFVLQTLDTFTNESVGMTFDIEVTVDPD